MATVLRLPGLPGLWPRASIPEFPGGWLVGWLVDWLVAALYYVLEVWEYNPPVLFPNHEGGMVQISIGLQANRYMDNIYIYIFRLIDVLNTVS